MTDDNFLVVLGLDAEKKPHAARFNFITEKAARKVAAIKGFQIGMAKTKEASDLAARLIEGKIFDSGRGLVPFVSKDIYDKLLGLLEIKEDAPSPIASAVLAAKPADLWAAIKVGSTVLAFDPEPGTERSWWPCKVVEISQDQKVLAVRWVQYPKLPPFRVKRFAVAILPSRP